MKCSACGQEILDTAIFCAYCGVKQEPPVPEEPVPVEEVPVEEIPVEEAPVVIPQPAPQPTYAPAPQPVYTPAPQPVYAPAPQPVYAPAPQNNYGQPTYRPQPQYAQPNPVPPQPQPSYVRPQPNYVPPVHPPVQPKVPHHPSPAFKLPTGRSLGAMFWLGLLTANIYKHVILSRIPEEVNMVASRRDGRRTQQYFWMLVLAPLTLGIYPLCWFHGLCKRIGGELKARRIAYDFRPAHFWLWYFLYFNMGTLLAGCILGVLTFLQVIPGIFLLLLAIILHFCTLIGPWIFTHKLMKAMNLMNTDYNARG